MATTNRLLIQIEDTPDSGVYATNCSLNSNKEFTIEASTSDFIEPNCEDEFAPNFQGRVIDVLSAGINGAGTTDPVSYGRLRAWMLSGEPRNVRVKLDIPLASGGGYYHGAFVMTQLGLAREGKGIVSSTMAFQSAGEFEWTDAAA